MGVVTQVQAGNKGIIWPLFDVTTQYLAGFGRHLIAVVVESCL